MKWANKNVRILIGSFFGSFFAVVLFLKKNKENHLEISWCHYFTPVYHRSWRYDLKFLRYRVGLTEIGNNRSFFALLPPPPPPNSPKKQNSQNIIKPGDIIILHICTENYDHVMYSSWDMVRKGQTDSWCPRIFFLIFVAFIGLVIKHAPLI